MSETVLYLTELNGAPGKIRTPDPQIRSLVLYPAELPAPVARTRREPGWEGGASRGIAAWSAARTREVLLFGGARKTVGGGNQQAAAGMWKTRPEPWPEPLSRQTPPLRRARRRSEPTRGSASIPTRWVRSRAQNPAPPAAECAEAPRLRSALCPRCPCPGNTLAPEIPSPGSALCLGAFAREQPGTRKDRCRKGPTQGSTRVAPKRGCARGGGGGSGAGREW